MTHILLTGAGFSRNWGGLLANEIFDYLLGSPKLTPDLREEIWRAKSDHQSFEELLRHFRGTNTHASHSLQKTLEETILAMFDEMNTALKSALFEFTQITQFVGGPRHARDFLSKFGAIFTLNQDTLLENKYEKPSDGRWRGVHRPGLKPLGEGLFQPATLPYTIPKDHQPYFKLHGSSDWRFNDSALLVMGGNKGRDIDDVPLLAAYRNEFCALACKADTRIMVIGYGFGDDHINEILIRASASGAKLFLVDPAAHKALSSGPATKLRENIIGISSRPLSTTLHNDPVERMKLFSFFQ